MSRRAVIVGSSVGGVRAAQALRSEGFEGSIVLIGEETHLPYDKPPLSKAFLSGKSGIADVSLLTADEAKELNIDLLLGHAAQSVDVEMNEVHLNDGTTVAFDYLIIATGARARPSPWGQRSGIHVLRTMSDSMALAKDLIPGSRLVIIGGGFIGAEVASTALGLGLTVTMVDPLPVPMARILNEKVGQIFTDMHSARGVATKFGQGVTGITGERGDLSVELTNGETIGADTVLVGIGAIPNVEWLEGSGLEIDNGIVCDSYSRALGFPHIHVVGDVARWLHTGHNELIRVEHWTNAVDQAFCVARNIVHPDDLRAYAPVEYVWSDQHDWKIQIVGRIGTDDFQVIGHPANSRFAVLYSHDQETLTGAIVVNWPRALIDCRRSVQSYSLLAEVAERLTAQVPAVVTPSVPSPTK